MAHVGVQDEDGETALHVAAWNGHKAAVSVLIANGANVGAQVDLAWHSGSPNDLLTFGDVLRTYLAKCSDDPKLWRSLGNEYIRQANYAEATASFDASIRAYLRDANVPDIAQLTATYPAATFVMICSKEFITNVSCAMRILICANHASRREDATIQPSI
jgi:ankyrin repeat protein